MRFVVGREPGGYHNRLSKIHPIHKVVAERLDRRVITSV